MGEGENRIGSFHLQLDSYANFEWISPYYFFHAPWAYLEFISCITQLIVKFLSLSLALGLHLDTFISNLQVKWNYIFQLFEVSPPDKVNSWGYHLRASKRSFVGFYLKCVGGWLGLSGWQTVSSCPADHQPEQPDMNKLWPLRAILRPETNKPRTFQLVEFKLGAFYICVKYKLCYLRCRITVCLCLPPRTSTSTASFLRRYPASQFQESLSECDMFAVSLNILPKIKT